MYQNKTLEQFAAWLFEHQGSVSIEPGPFPGSRLMRVEIKEPGHFAYEYPITDEQLHKSNADIRTQILLTAWNTIDRQAGH